MNELMCVCMRLCVCVCVFADARDLLLSVLVVVSLVFVFFVTFKRARSSLNSIFMRLTCLYQCLYRTINSNKMPFKIFLHPFTQQ